MPAKVTVNKLTVVHASSNGMVMLMPDVCLTPAPPAPPIPVPYPNIAMSSDTAQGSSSVKCDGNPVMVQNSTFSTSSGDEAGSIGGVVTHCTKGKAEFVNFSFDVKFDGKMVARMMDPMVGNEMAGKPPNTPPSPEMQPPMPVVPPPQPPTGDWSIAGAG